MTIAPIAPIVPAPTRLARDLDRGEEIVALVRSSLGDTGDGALAFTRCAVVVLSEEAVDRLAGKWGVVPRWTAGRTAYVAHRVAAGHEAEAEVVYHAPAPVAAGSEAAA
jgi:hypothetical protein